MKYILIHGLGQDDQSWNKTSLYLKQMGIDTLCPNLFALIKNGSKDYQAMYHAFSCLCHEQQEKVNLCGLSLGGLLALDFVKAYPEKVNSIILIGTPYQIPKMLFKGQSLLFHMMPKKTFEKMGCSKMDFMTLVDSMCHLDMTKDLDKITCKSLILCGVKDKVNMKSAKLLHTCIKNSEFMVIEDASHEVNIDNPEILSERVYDFWK